MPQPRRNQLGGLRPPLWRGAYSSSSSSSSSGSGDAESGGAGEPVSAADPDGDTLTYSLSGGDAGSFEIDASTGQLWSKAPLDYEAKSTYTVVVSVRDGRDFNQGAKKLFTYS